ncbi:NAD(P)/FAD-dependent oxidoreductase [Phycicoccus flavus]|uniref:NAD(P)/FAD-dependent oxidoreductase n=1 Tax=Phycicoccus flavus TaxID=2502783 RepID=UPI000FEB606C|nr:FAD-dependent oxidoreductase [Phycicoccus flavus]NHA70226.1 FAD-binding oxidoreductase [Phycicoccus flavus]
MALSAPPASPRADAVVVGAGVVGASVAFELARRGREVLVVDALPAAGFGSTSASSAIVRFSYSTAAGCAMAWEGLHYWRGWANHLADGGSEVPDERGLARLVTCGMALVDDGSGWVQRVQGHFDALGVPYESWDAAELARRVPLVDARRLGPPVPVDSERFWADPDDAPPLPGALWSPDAGYVDDPQLASHNLQRAAEARGATFRFRTRVVAVERDAGRVTGVRLEDGSTVAAPVVVNVAGPASARVNDLAGLTGTMRIRTRPMRQEVHHLPSPLDDTGTPLTCLLSDDDSGVYVRPGTGGTLSVGSLEPACDELEWIEDLDDYPATVTPAGWERQTLRLAKRLPGLRIPNRPAGVVGVYDVADDWIPVYDRTDLDGFYVAIGTSGNQFKNAPVAGHCVAELVEAVEGGHDHDADPLVVTARHTGAPLDLGVFSRNREVTPGSSYTVQG